MRGTRLGVGVVAVVAVGGIGRSGTWVLRERRRRGRESSRIGWEKGWEGSV